MKPDIHKLIKKEMKRAGISLRQEEARCRELYPDWRNDEYNLLDYKFIWGYTKDSTTTPSFYTWDDAYVYYNRADKRYYMHIDTGLYEAVEKRVAWGEIDRLFEIKNAFALFLSENGLLLSAPFCFDLLQQEGATSLTELYIKFNILFEGYCAYLDSSN
jgi:hypothetical protein